MNKLKSCICSSILSIVCIASVSTYIFGQKQGKKNQEAKPASPPSTSSSQSAASPATWKASDFISSSDKAPKSEITSPWDRKRIYERVKGGNPKYIKRFEGENLKPEQFVRIHGGTDVTAFDSKGNPIPAKYKTPVAGKVTEVRTDGNYNTVTITTPEGQQIKFLHSDPDVKVNQEVKVGDPIGTTNGWGEKKNPQTGKIEKAKDAYAPHLHYDLLTPTGVRVDKDTGEATNEVLSRAELARVGEKEYKAREYNVKKIGESVRGKRGAGSTKPQGSLDVNKPELGGILFDKQVEMLSDLSDIHGAFYDNSARRIVFVGESHVDAPAMDKNLLAVALRAVYSGEFPGVSIDPSSDPKVMMVRYLGKTENTRFGAIMFEADRKLKALSRGEDNLSRLPVQSSVSGYQSISKRQATETDRTEGRSLYRLWFKPNKLTMKRTVDGNSIAFSESTMICDWENMQGVNPGSAVQSWLFGNRCPIPQNMGVVFRIPI